MRQPLRELCKKGIYLGTSSWKYPGWRGHVYQEAYPSEKKFNELCLTEYANHFPAVGVDHTYYAWPLASTFEKYVAQTPDGFLFALKATDAVTVFKFPNLPRYGKLAGKLNPDFLSADLFLEKFIQPLSPFRKRMAPILVEFSQFYPGMIKNGSEFTDRVTQFCSAVKKESGWELAIELRNRNWLQPEYFNQLVTTQVGHVFNSWTRMPTLAEQLSLTEGAAFPFLASRILLEPGVGYETAVEAFAPYDRIQVEHPTIRKSAADLIRRALKQGIRAFVFINNRCEGCAPKTIDGIINELGEIP